MKKLILILALASAGALFAVEAPKPVEPPKAEAKPDPVAALTKERDDLKQQLTGLQATNAYLQVVAERNEMAVRLLQANARADDLQKQLDAEKAKTAALETEKVKWDEAVKKSVDAGLLKK